MTFDQFLHELTQVAATGGALAVTAAKIRDVVAHGAQTGTLPAATTSAIATLPQSATAHEIVAALGPQLGFGGALFVAAGDNGGGSVYARDVNWAAGDGPGGGGHAVVRGGAGGPHGNGGDVTIIGGTIRGGNAK